MLTSNDALLNDALLNDAYLVEIDASQIFDYFDKSFGCSNIKLTLLFHVIHRQSASIHYWINIQY